MGKGDIIMSRLANFFRSLQFGVDNRQFVTSMVVGTVLLTGILAYYKLRAPRPH
jgi:hypothetical protein